MGGSEKTDSTKQESRSLTAAERQDIYNGAIGSIKNTYTQSGLPYDGSGSMDYGAAQFNGNAGTSGTGVANVSANLNGSLYNASGSSSNNLGKGGSVTLDPKTYFEASAPNVKMPTGGADPGGVNFPTYVAPDYQNPGSYQSPGDAYLANVVDPGRFRTAGPYQDAGAYKEATLQTAGPYQDAGEYRSAGPLQTAGPYQDAGAGRSLTGEDYGRLEQQLSAGQLADLEHQKQLQDQAANEALAARGIWSSGIAQRDDALRTDDYNRARMNALGNAAAQRYSMQSAEQQALNQYGLNRANSANAFNVGQADSANSFNLQNSAAQNQYGLNRANSANAFNIGQADSANSFNLQNSAAQNQYGLNRANSANAFNVGQADSANTYGLNRSNAMTQANLANASNLNQFNLGNASAKNQYNLNAAGAANTFNTNQQGQKYTAGWAPLNYLANIWNGTTGQVSGSNSFGQSIGFSL